MLWEKISFSLHFQNFNIQGTKNSGKHRCLFIFLALSKCGTIDLSLFFILNNNKLLAYLTAKSTKNNGKSVVLHVFTNGKISWLSIFILFSFLYLNNQGNQNKIDKSLFIHIFSLYSCAKQCFSL